MNLQILLEDMNYLFMVVGSEKVHSIWYYNRKQCFLFFLNWLYVYCQSYSYRDFCDKKLNECCGNVCTVCRNCIERNGLFKFFFFRDLIILFPSQVGAFLFMKRFLSFIRHSCWICITIYRGYFWPITLANIFA